MFKIPDFSIAPCLCKQAGLDLSFCMKRSRSPYVYTCIGRPSPFLHDCTMCCALRRSHLNTNKTLLKGENYTPLYSPQLKYVVEWELTDNSLGQTI